jgi:hypothetical protein
MKANDIVSTTMIQRAIVDHVDGEWTQVWWPCPEFGRHVRIVPTKDLVVTGEVYQGTRPKRIRDHHLDYQSVAKDNLTG